MVALLAAVLRRPGLGPVEREYTLTALMKLSARLSGVADKVQVRCVVIAVAFSGFQSPVAKTMCPRMLYSPYS